MAIPEFDNGIPLPLLLPFIGQGCEGRDVVSLCTQQAASQYSSAGQVEPDEPAASCDPCNASDPFVSRGRGAPKGLSVFEHVVLSFSLNHPLSTSVVDLPGDLVTALDFVIENSPCQVDQLRSERLHRLTMKAHELEKERSAWRFQSLLGEHEARDEVT